MAEVFLENVSKSFSGNKVVDCINLRIADGEFVSLVGPSGCGKTTILRMIAGLEEINEGKLFVDNVLYNRLPVKKRGIAMVFQSYALFPHMTVMENLAFGLRIRNMAKNAAIDKIKWAVKITGLDGLEKRYPRELSGGQRQRVAVGRALVLDPKVLLLDEPLSNLDTALRERMTTELKRLHRQIGKTIIYVTHNQMEAMTLSDRIAVMRKGKIVQCDTPNNTYNVPSSKFVATFIGNPHMNIFYAVVTKDKDEIFLSVEDKTIFIEKAYMNNLNKYVGQTVCVGIRPQHIKHSLMKVGRRHSDTQISVEVDVVEALGERNLVICKFGKTSLTFLVNTDISPVPGENVPVVIAGRKLHFFHPNTKERLF